LAAFGAGPQKQQSEAGGDVHMHGAAVSSRDRRERRIKALTTSPTTFAFATVLIVAGVLAGCRAEEQGRPLVIKGTYRGKTETPLSEAKLRELRDRVSMQSNSSGNAGGVAILERPSAEKPAPSSKSLNERLRSQEAPPNVPSGSSVRPPHAPQASTATAAPNNEKTLNERLKLQEGPPSAAKKSDKSDVSKPPQPRGGTANASPMAPQARTPSASSAMPAAPMAPAPPSAPAAPAASATPTAAPSVTAPVPAPAVTAVPAAPSAPAAAAPSNPPKN
jgi:hypothetical protein